MVDQIVDDLVDTAFKRDIASIDAELRMFGSFVGAGNSSEFLDFSCASFGIKPFCIALLANAEISCTVNLNEIACDHQASGFVTVSPKRRHKRGENDDTGIEKQLCDLTNSSNIFFPIRIGKAEVLAKTMTNVISV